MRRFPLQTTWLGCVLCFVLTLLAGCQPPRQSDSGKAGGGKPLGETIRLAVIPKGTTHEFWKSVHYGAVQAAREHTGHKVEILWLGPQLENDRDGQITIVQNFVTKNVDGICLAPLDSRALVSAVEEAKQAAIPVVIFDSGLEDASGVLHASYVATDNGHGGELAAAEMAKQLGEKGRVIMLRYTTGSESTEQREEGFLSKIKQYPGIEVISSDQYCGTTPESSLDKAQQLINRYAGKFDGIFAVCEPNATGVLGALEDARLAGKVVFIGFDPSPRMVKAMEEGKMQGIVLQDPVKMGYLAVQTMLKHLTGEPVEKRVVTGEYIATTENMNGEEMSRLLSPPQQD